MEALPDLCNDRVVKDMESPPQRPSSEWISHMQIITSSYLLNKGYQIGTTLKAIEATYFLTTFT